MTRYLLDTNICIEVIRQRGGRALERLRTCAVGGVGISAITLAELMHGAEKSAWPERNRAAVYRFSAPLEILPFDDGCAAAYGRIRAGLERQGDIIGPMDLLIAAHALCVEAVLITGNEREFRRVEGLRVEIWLEAGPSTA